MPSGIQSETVQITLFKRLGLVAGMVAGLLLPLHAQADGCFVAPPFVWNKHKDINEPTQKAIMIYDAGHEDLILQVKYDGSVPDFGWLVPVPSQPTVKPGSMECFYELSRYTQEKWEPSVAVAGESSFDMLSAASSSGHPSEPPPVKVVEIKTVGAYDVAVLSATETGALERWLTANGFAYPQDKAAVLADYIHRHWYFIAIKIDLRKSGGFNLVSSLPRQPQQSLPTLAEKMAAGELQPLRISFASDECVFPLKISSVNGSPSEVQVYVLSPEPLVERRLFEKKFPEIHQRSLAQFTRRIETKKRMRERERTIFQQFHPGLPGFVGPAMVDDTNIPMDIILRDSVPYDALLNYGEIGARELPACARLIPGFKAKRWWLTKQTWTFQPEEMQDLVFQPAASVFLEDLATEEGFYVARNLAQLGTKAIPAVLQALQSTNDQVRIHAASILGEGSQSEVLNRDSRILALVPALFHDPAPMVREAAAGEVAWNWRLAYATPLVGLLQDADPGVQQQAAFALKRGYQDRAKFLPAVEQLVTNRNPLICANALEITRALQGTVPKEELLPMLSLTNARIASAAISLLEHSDYAFSYTELTPLLHNPLPMARMSGIRILGELADKQAVPELITLLYDPEIMVRNRAWELLQTLTGKNLPADRPDKWEQWWAQNKIPVLIADYTQSLNSEPANGELQHMRGCLYYDEHKYTNALADFRRACQLGSDTPDYSHYRLWLLRARLGEANAATRELAKYLASRKTGQPNDWPSQVGRFLAGQLSENDFINSAKNAHAQTEREQHCEAWFYAGSKRLIAHDKTTAVDDFQKCVGTGVKNFEEYGSAGAELKWLGIKAADSSDNE